MPPPVTADDKKLSNLLPDPGAEQQQPCPFQAIAHAIDNGILTRNDDPAPAPAAGGGASRFKPTTLEYMAIPEGRSLVKPEILATGLKKMEDDNDMGTGSHQPMKVQCPMSGGSALLALQQKVDQDKAAHAASLVQEDDAKSSHSRSESKKSGSRKSGSRKSGSRKSGSKVSKSKASGASSNSRRRGRKIPTFSEWEADNYIPHIKASWHSLTQSTDPRKVGDWFFDTLGEADPKLAKLLGSVGRDAMSAHLYQALLFISVSVDDPPTLPNKCRELVAVHIEREVNNADILTFGKVLMQMLEHFLGKGFDMTVRTAWTWLWTWLSGVMCMVMDEALEESTLISQSFDIVMENYPGNRFGELIFDMLFSLAPNLKAVFPQPKQLFSVKLSELTATLVSYSGDPATMEEQIPWLGVRHVTYGARAEHTSVMGQVMMNSLERAVGDEWTAEMHKAWMDLWTSTCAAMFKVTTEAELHGECVRELWNTVITTTTQQKFGKTLRESLLAGTEWVQSLSVGIQEGLDDHLKSSPRLPKVLNLDAKAKRASVDARKESKDGKQSFKEGASSQSGENADIILTQQEEDDQKEKAGKDSSTDADAIGKKFWEMITDMLAVLWEPERMNEKIIVQTTRLYALGIRPDNIETIGNGIGTAIRRTLGALWKDTHREAWVWFWGMMSRSMEQVLSSLMRNDVLLIRDRWEECKETKPAEEFGELIFQELGRLAPHVIGLFKKPKSIQALQFISAIDIIVGFNEDPVNFFEILRPLAIRHIRYGVKADYARAFGKAILRAIKTVLGVKYDGATSLAFDTLWLRVSCCVTRALAAGSNLVAVALITEDIDQMTSAMDGTPRGERFKFLTTLELNGESFSPLYWSIKESQLEISTFIVNDLLSIRADRHAYYYGREVMWKAHPDLMLVLCKDMPLLLPTLFDGMLWHARNVYEGCVRVNYYLREMYGDPKEVDDPWNGPMGVMVLYGQPENFLHPVVERLLTLKFDRFGRKMFSVLQAWFTLILALFSASAIVLGDSCDTAPVLLRQAALACGAITLAAQTVLIARQGATGQCVPLSALKIPLPRYLSSPWNITRFISLVMLVACLATEPCEGGGGGGEWRMVLVAFTGLLLWMQLLQVLTASAKFAAFVYTIGCMLPEMLRIFAVILLLLISFACAMTSLRIEEYADPLSSLVVLTQIMLRVGDPGDYLIENAWGLAFLIGMGILCVVAMLNVLVAQFITSYAELVKQEKAFAMLNRAYICVEMESLLPQVARQRFYNELGFDSPLEFDKGDLGPAGGVQFRQPSSIRVSPGYIPDRVQRFTGESSPMDPWPSSNAAEVEDLSVPEEEDGDGEEGAAGGGNV